MTAKNWLQRAYNIDRQIKSKLELIEMWKELATKMTANYGYGFGRSAPSDTCRAERYGILIADAEEELKQDAEELIKTKQEIGRALRLLEAPEHRLLLEQRYILCKSWGEVASFMDYGETHVRGYLHGQALQQLQRLIQLNTT